MGRKREEGVKMENGMSEKIIFQCNSRKKKNTRD